MKKIMLFFLIFVCVMLQISFVFAGEDSIKFIDVNPFIHKIPVSIPPFIAVSDRKNLETVMQDGNRYLKKLLQFTSYFKFDESNSVLGGLVATRIDFEKWKKAGDDMLISVGCYLSGDSLEMEFRLFDVVKKELLVGKRFKGKKNKSKVMIRKFASAVMSSLFDNKGLFESRLLFVSDHGGGKDIYLCNFDGTGIHQVTADKNIAISPSWSYDNKWIAFTSYKRHKPEIFIRSLDLGKGYIISKGNLNITPEWIPGKFCIAGVFNLRKDPDIYMVSVNGEILKKLAGGFGIDVSPSFSRDGSRMAFVSKRGGSPQIYIKNIKDNSIQRITYEGAYNTSPSWSPTGRWISYAGMTKDDGINIYLIRPDGTSRKQLTVNSGDNEDPVFSPDGSLIAFSSSRNGKKKIFVMTKFGDDQRLLIRDLTGNQSEPAWSH